MPDPAIQHRTQVAVVPLHELTDPLGRLSVLSEVLPEVGLLRLGVVHREGHALGQVVIVRVRQEVAFEQGLEIEMQRQGGRVLQVRQF